MVIYFEKSYVVPKDSDIGNAAFKIEEVGGDRENAVANSLEEAHEKFGKGLTPTLNDRRHPLCSNIDYHKALF